MAQRVLYSFSNPKAANHIYNLGILLEYSRVEYLEYMGQGRAGQGRAGQGSHVAVAAAAAAAVRPV